MTDQSSKAERHILSLSGGKDSTALAVYMRDRVPEMAYVFCDTGKELKETLEYLDRLEALLGKPIVRLKQAEDAFDDILSQRRNFLPSPRMRWCTEQLKIRPFERYVGDDPVVNYVGIRADEDRKGYISSKPNIRARYPFVEDGIVREDVERILNESGLGKPAYYEWRSRSGCYFCFFQQKIEWIGLLERHPDLYQKAMEYEKEETPTGERYTWVERESLRELAQPERVAQIKAQYERKKADASGRAKALTLGDVLANEEDANEERACLICHL